MEWETIKNLEKSLQDKLLSIPGFPRTISRHRKPALGELDQLYSKYPELLQERVTGRYYHCKEEI